MAESEYIKHSVGPILTEALQSLILHIPYPGSKPSPLATSVDPIDYLGKYLLRHAEQEEERKALEELKAIDRAVIEKFAEDEARLEASRMKLGESLAVRLSQVAMENQKNEEPAVTLAAVGEQLSTVLTETSTTLEAQGPLSE